jgi:nicotinamide mononucleotide adenylyltransferase
MTDKKKKTAVLAFGRMNPPTTGHEKLINRTHQVAKKHGGTAHVP